jgi:peptidoglycan/LPS O-acetylase OafA/YrhL
VGVELFFVISGFVVALPFATQARRGAPAPSLRDYYLRRLTRIEPPYLLTLFLFFLVMSLAREDGGAELLPHLLLGTVYAHNLVYCPQHNPIHPVAWSLEVEIQFYLVAPLLAAVMYGGDRRYRRPLQIAALMGAASLTAVLRRAGFACVGYNLVGQLAFFGAGMLLADVFADDWRGRLPAPRPFWDAIALPGWILLPVVFWEYRVVPVAALPLVLGALVAVSMLSPTMRRFLRLTPLVIAGGMCYTIYLLHLPMIDVTAAIVRDLSSPPSFGLGMGLLLVCVLPPLAAATIAFFVLIEKPCMSRDWPRNVAEWLRRRYEGRKGIGPPEC